MNFSTLRMGLATALLVAPLLSFAAVECNVSVQRYFVGDGILWVIWQEGGVGTIFQSDPDFKPTLATVLASLLGNRQLIVRYSDGATCSDGPAPIIGIWIK